MDKKPMQNAYASREDMLRNQIMDAAITCMNHKGVDKTRIGDIANELGIARQTVYNYFSNKNELFDAMFTREAVSLAENIASHIQQFDSLEDKFCFAFLHAIDEFPKHPVLNHVTTTGGQYLNEMGVSREKMQAFGELVLAEVLEDNPFLKAQSSEICEFLSRNIISFLMMPDESPRNRKELENFTRRRILPGIGLNNHSKNNP